MLRRLFLSRVASFPALVGVPRQSSSPATNGAPAGGRFQAARHDKDDWYDQLPGRHRVVFDTWMAAEFADAIRFVGNYFRGSADGYSLTAKDVAVVVIARHRTAPFAYNDAMWAKYGKFFSERMAFVDPKTKQAPTSNPYSEQVSSLIKQGVHFGICNLTTRSYSRTIADATGVDAEAVYKELTTSTFGNSHFVAAGVLGVTRAQEHGYVLVSVG